MNIYIYIKIFIAIILINIGIFIDIYHIIYISLSYYLFLYYNNTNHDNNDIYKNTIMILCNNNYKLNKELYNIKKKYTLQSKSDTFINY